MSAGAERRPRRVGEDVIVALYRPAELFSVEPEAMLERAARIEPGADEIVHELLGRSRVERQARIVLTLPAEQITPGMAETLHAALRRYCEARLARVQRETEMAWRQGLRSLGTGSILFVVGLLLSSGFLQPDVPDFWQNLLGNGVFLVIGWVGLWYPLDLLFFARQPLKREALIVEAISRMPLLGATRRRLVSRPATFGRSPLGQQIETRIERPGLARHPAGEPDRPEGGDTERMAPQQVRSRMLGGFEVHIDGNAVPAALRRPGAPAPRTRRGDTPPSGGLRRSSTRTIRTTS